ncbi:MAG: pitrilysin family protein [Alkalibacterium sp.]|uniref:EF-P 5-aminopentanol modification-associated protein YfmH n=1 Tax=Alkalibacterium sp. TaxID=1872447 RepID=UPI003970D5FF
MDIKVYKHLEEKIYTEKLGNGLQVKLIPKKEYKKIYAVLFADFGSVDRTFITRGEYEYRSFPYGIAHFLEHKLFETEDGDVSNIFSSQGASVNAFTSNTKTAYMCSFTANLQQNIETLLDFVQTPYFTYSSVEDEKSIITQEIQMYKDDPDWNLSIGLIENLYPKHPLRMDVAGTVESIQSIDVDMLIANYDTFYHPSNLQIILIGNLNPDDAMEYIKENQESKFFPPAVSIDRSVPDEADIDILKYRETKLPVNIPKVLVGVKGDKYNLEEKAAFRHIIKMEIMLDLLFGDTSSTYLSLYNDELIDDSFSYEYIFERSFDYVSIGGDSKFPEDLASSIKHVLLNTQGSQDMTFEHFSLIKKKLTGQYIQALNSLEVIAQHFVELPYEEITIFDSLSILESITFEEVKRIAHDYFKKEVMSVFSVKPQNN